MTINPSLFSSKNIVWETPKNLFDKLNQRFKFSLDVCANESNTKCSKFYTEDDNGLVQNWSGSCWMNPPYGKTINQWMKKAYEESQKPEVDCVVCLIPARTDTKYWHQYCMNSSEIMFVKGRLKFGNSKNSAPFPSAIVVFSKSHNVPSISSI